MRRFKGALRSLFELNQSDVYIKCVEDAPYRCASQTARPEPRATASAMREDVLFGPAHQVELRARRQEAEAGLGFAGAALARQPRRQHLAQPVQIEHVGRGVFELLRRQRVGAPSPTIAAIFERLTPSSSAQMSFSPCRSV